MKIVLLSLNAKYIHTNLAIRYLAESVSSGHEAVLFDFTIHESPMDMAAKIYAEHPDMVCMSVYLWNRWETFRLVRIIKRIIPRTLIVLGGPEVSYDSFQQMQQNPDVDMIVCGEGEEAFVGLVNEVAAGNMNLEKVPNVCYRRDSMIIENEKSAPLKDMGWLPFPYRSETKWDPNRIYYYESSRGCPFSCSFCMSSLDQSLRQLSWGRVRRDLDRLLQSGIKLVKFVDRTFNCDPDRAVQIWEYLIQNYNENMVFHFEIAGDLLDDKTQEFLALVPKGYFQFEIGVQSTNQKTLEAVNRKTDLERVFRNVRRLKSSGHIHIYLDLIAGLPYEDLPSMVRSFNQVYDLEPDMLQLGFLKLLSGTKIRDEAEIWKYQYTPDPPYQVLSNQWLTFSDLRMLMDIERVLGIFHNSGRFVHSLRFLAGKSFDAFLYFKALSEFWKEHGLDQRGVAIKEQFSYLAEYGQKRDLKHYENFLEALMFDFCLYEKPGEMPVWYPDGGQMTGKEKQELLGSVLPRILPHLAGETARTVRKNTELVLFKYDCIAAKEHPVLVLFDYSSSKYGQGSRFIRIDRRISEALDISND